MQLSMNSWLELNLISAAVIAVVSFLHQGAKGNDLIDQFPSTRACDEVLKKKKVQAVLLCFFASSITNH